MAPKKKINLDKVKAARLEAAGEGTVVTFGGSDFTLPPEIPASVLDGLGASTQGDAAGIRRAIFDLLGEDQATRYYAGKPSVQDLIELLKAAVQSSGLGDEDAPDGGLGESSASDASS